MVKINPMTDADFDKKPGNYFDVGVHTVIITGAKLEKPAGGSPYINFELSDEDENKGDARLYMSEAAAVYSIPKLAGIAVHDKDSEADKQKVRDGFKAIDDTDKIDDKFLAKFVGMQAWVLVEEDPSAPNPKGGFYKRTSLYHYEPKAKPQTAASLLGGTSLSSDESDSVPFL